MPLVYLRVGSGDLTFLQALKANFVTQETYLKSFWHIPELPAVAAGDDLLPAGAADQYSLGFLFWDPSKLGIAVTTWILHLAHGALLVICVWTAFDPVFSPHRKGLMIPALDLLCALSIGYFAGYFLLVFKPLSARSSRGAAPPTALNRLSLAAVWALAVLVPLGLFIRNFPQIRMTNGPALKEYASLLAKNLPPRAVVLCDSESAQIDYPQKLWLTEAWLAHAGKARRYMLLDSLALQAPTYHHVLRQRYGRDFPNVLNSKSSKKVPDMALVKMVTTLADERPLSICTRVLGIILSIFIRNPTDLRSRWCATQRIRSAGHR